MSGRDRLGKGLGALLGEYLDPETSSGDVHSLPVKSIVPNPVQPRRVFKEGELEELAASIRENGLLQPLVVRPAPGAQGRYELVAGERRLRAVTSLGWPDVAVLVRETSDETLLVLALVENLQREALNPIEEAEGYAALSEQYGMSQSDIAGVVGTDRSTVANLIRLLKLPPSIRRLLEDGSLSMGHARALLCLGLAAKSPSRPTPWFSSWRARCETRSPPTSPSSKSGVARGASRSSITASTISSESSS